MQMADQISELPDEILSHIISFLPTEEAFGTRLLSKRWFPIWLFNPNPNLDLDQQRFLKTGQSYSTFTYIVSMSIYRRSVNQPIKKMRLRCDCQCSESESESESEWESGSESESEWESDHKPICDVRQWLAAAAVRGIQHLELQVSQSLSYFSFRDLVVLKMKNSSVVIGVSEVYLPSLKTLHMDGVHFHLQNSLVQLINGCPILEDLEAKNILGYPSNNVEAYECKYLTKLVRAYICNLQMLCIYGVRLKALTNAEFLCFHLEKYDYDNLPMFPNLTHLELKGDVPCYVLFQVLERFPKLQNLVVEMALPYSTYDKSIDLQRSVFPIRVLSSEFKSCTITNYDGQCHKHIWLFLQHVMKSSTSLRIMTIHCFPFLDRQEILEMQNEVLSYTTRRVLLHPTYNVKELPLTATSHKLVFLITYFEILTKFVSTETDIGPQNF